jgi:HSP20 family molecular chaperone IbpA
MLHLLDLYPIRLTHLLSLPFAGATMPVEALTDSHAYVIRAELPGVDPTRIRVTIIDGELRLSAERSAPVPRTSPGWRTEFQYGHLARRVPLPASVHAGEVVTSYARGVLEVRVQAAPTEAYPVPGPLTSTLAGLPEMLLGGPGIRIEEYTDGGEHVVRADVAGADPARDVTATITAGQLRLRVRRSAAAPAPAYSEFRYGNHTRTLTLPSGAHELAATATYRSGILEFRVPVTAWAADGWTVPIDIVEGATEGSIP